MVDPSEFKSRLIPDFMSMRSQALNNISSANLGNVSAIKQMGAARGLPVGAINSMLQGQAYQGGRAAASIEPELQRSQAESIMNYLGLMNRFKTAQEEARRSNVMDFGADIGGLTKIMLMQKMKMFDMPDAGVGGGDPNLGISMNNFDMSGTYRGANTQSLNSPRLGIR
jgi:hypothetical protein